MECLKTGYAICLFLKFNFLLFHFSKWMTPVKSVSNSGEGAPAGLPLESDRIIP